MTMENANANSKAKISVWWDIETCPFPTNNFDHIYYFAKNITLALSNANLHGKLSFFVYANSNLIPSKVLHALNIMGISLCHVPTKGVFNGITQDLLLWVFENPPPANILLISSDDSFSRFLHDLSMQGFNTILSAPSTVDASFTAAANTFWHWPTLISRGRSLNAIEQMTMENANTNISVWWDVGNCQIPTNIDSIDCIVKNIRLALLNANLRGKLSIFAYGNKNLIASEVQHALSTTDIPLCHVPTGDVYKDIMFDMFKWVSENPAPASIMLISSDDSFSRLLYDLSVRRGYNILLAAPSKVCASLTSTANAIWLWSTLISGGSPLKTAEQLSTSLLDQVQDGESNI